MGRIALLIALVAVVVTSSFAQITFDRPKVEGLLANPYTAPAAQDVVVEAAVGMIKDMDINLDPEKTKKEEGILVAKPVIFTKGTVTVSQLEHFSHCPAVEARNWTRGRYTLQMVIEAVLEMAAEAGVDDVVLIAALALHRRMHDYELRHALGDRIYDAFEPNGLLWQLGEERQREDLE